MIGQIPVLSIQCGKIRPFRGNGEPSAIGKSAIHGRVRIHRLGLDGDEQADLTVHGGPDKAIHHYPYDHYSFWKDAIGDHPLLREYGAFGENISTCAMTEETVCIGDRWRLGTALVEVSQGRQPCWKLDHRFGGLTVNARMVKARCAGWYYRVLEEGQAGAGDGLELIDRPYPDWTVARAFGLLIAGDHRHDRAGLDALATVKVLASPWKARCEKLRGN